VRSLHTQQLKYSSESKCSLQRKWHTNFAHAYLLQLGTELASHVQQHSWAAALRLTQLEITRSHQCMLKTFKH
jgi:hypothetical protein